MHAKLDCRMTMYAVCEQAAAWLEPRVIQSYYICSIPRATGAG